MWIINTLIPFLIVLGVLIFIHELGHYLVAKKVGVRVEKFSLGFGPRLIGFKRGDTDYFISALPLGGYVKLTGEDPTEELSGSSHELSSRSIPERLGVFAAGSIMNLLLPLVLLPIVYMAGIEAPAYTEKPPYLGWVIPNSPAAKVGLLPGDLVLSVNQTKVAKWDELLVQIMSSPGQTLLFKVKRGADIKDFSITAETDETMGSGYIGVVYPMPAEVGQVMKGYPAAAAGLKSGDKILAIDAQPIVHWAQMTDIIRKGEGREHRVTVARGAERLSMVLRPKKDTVEGVYLIGITPREEMTLKKYSFFGACGEAFDKMKEYTVLTMTVLYKLITFQLGPKMMGGPIMIAQVAGAAAQTGVTDLIFLMAVLSLQLGILNLFPIPALDGGHILFLAIEGITGKPVDSKVREVAQSIGFALLILLMALISFYDIQRVFR